MTDTEWTVLAQYLRSCADKLGLRDWTIRLLHDRPNSPETHAHTECVYGRKLAEIKVCRDFREQDPEEQRHTIIHELLHLHTDAADSIVNNEIREALGKQTGYVAYEAHHRAIEIAVDDIATAIAQYFPLIEWSKVETSNG